MIGAAGLAAVAAVGPGAGLAAASTEVDLCAGVAVVGDHPQVLCRQDSRWVLIGDDGVAKATTGLAGALVLDVATDARGALAAGSIDGEAALWSSADGLAWREVLRLRGRRSMFTAVAASPSAAMALGSDLSGEDVPRGTIAARRLGANWSLGAVTGLEPTAYVTTLAVGRNGWLAGTIGSQETVLHVSSDGAAWSELAAGRLDDAAVQGVLDDGSVRWVGNAIGGSAALAGTVGAGRGPAGVPDRAHAVGLVRTHRGRVSYWLLDGKLQTAEVR
ncbi:hypothetical protein SAMN05192558_10839 [Actinokineospora alba]|uniref:Uncharacterized protein n=1 Tax=Actinokineospora alba TaxID=504798 RepID=A0A1H0RMS7_9PSEU|nr:hypothetical protein [Actinokineospora alba]TDP67001.1 hypothetical protein C8E96_2520 [Actinokineospora alba]SDJ31949.1 hypothetical protein SAMN05421871_11339 [Actinokineospora alba]SDP30803.1 hypothetical protein SAMN05192558_10839 [Actinokineospora alba]